MTFRVERMELELTFCINRLIMMLASAVVAPRHLTKWWRTITLPPKDDRRCSILQTKVVCACSETTEMAHMDM